MKDPYVAPELDEIPIEYEEFLCMTSGAPVHKDKDKNSGIDSMEWEEEE